MSLITITKKKGTGVKRLNVIVPTSLHNRFKAATAAQGFEMTAVLLEFIEKYADKHGPATSRKGRRG